MQITKALFFILIAGLSIGWLVGLSQSPTIQATLTSLMAIVASGVGFFLKKHKSSESPTDGTLHIQLTGTLLAGIALGATFGLVARNHAWFGAIRADITTQNTKGGKTPSNSTAPALLTGLIANHVDETMYDDLRTATKEEIRSKMRATGVESIVDFANHAKSDDDLLLFVKDGLTKDKR